MSETLEIIIRTTNNKYADFTIQMLSSLTISDLKQNITLHHPTKPLPKDQRLIYSGKLLDNKNILNQIFIKSNPASSFMVHLVLDSDKNETVNFSHQQSPTKTSTITETSRSISSHSATYEQYVNELNKYQEQLQKFMSNPHGISSTTPVYSQYCSIHHHMFQNYLTHQNPSTSTRSIPVTPTTANQSAGTPPPAPNNNLVQENIPVRVLHILIEIFLLYSMIHFYSTFDRFLFLFAIIVLLCLHFRGYLFNQQRQHVQNQPVPPIVEQVPVNNTEQQVDAEEIQNEDQDSNDIQVQESPSVTPPRTEPVTAHQITPTRLLLTAISTFFSSLIPEGPQRI